MIQWYIYTNIEEWNEQKNCFLDEFYPQPTKKGTKYPRDFHDWQNDWSLPVQAVKLRVSGWTYFARLMSITWLIFYFRCSDVRICVESLTASHLKPNFFSLRVKEIDLDFTEELHRHEVNEKELEHNNREAKEFLRWVELELTRLINKVKSIERGMQAARTTHADFHEQSVSMQRTLIWFPYIQLFVTFLTAVFVSRSLSSHFKKKGIIF